MALKKWMDIYGTRNGPRMSRQLKVIADADSIIAQAVFNDNHHKKAIQISEFLISTNAQVIYPATAIIEAITYMQRVLNSSNSAYATAIVFTDPDIKVEEVNQKILSRAISYFSPTISKKNTMFDCIVASIAEGYSADAIFSFDKFYKKCGFKLASEMI